MTHTAYNVAWNSYLHYLNLKAGGRDASRSRPKVQALKEFSAHQLRHTMASTLYDAEVDAMQDREANADGVIAAWRARSKPAAFERLRERRDRG